MADDISTPLSSMGLYKRKKKEKTFEQKETDKLIKNQDK
jgi:hypothetical protein